ncbi:hypothetical protein J1N35_024061 [Gossypium stocksii]|uniref:Uncharacterized protein n=1 Tax=Gossypium stocksii TaxID=47602 RepID=A0A9D3VJ86_9ROSI|nr:hypothetical protein J1N35_024061 [Gossypium stocksii]
MNLRVLECLRSIKEGKIKPNPAGKASPSQAMDFNLNSAAAAVKSSTSFSSL